MYIKSSLIRVFPSAYRSGTDNTTTATVFDPESKLTVEDNLAGFYRHSLTRDSFVVALEDAGTSGTFAQKESFVIHGYYFEVENLESIVSSLVPADGTSVYAHIFIKNGNSNTDYTFESLTNDAGNVAALDNTSSMDASPLPDTYSFQGVLFDLSESPEVRSGCTMFTLKLFTVSVNTSGGCWKSGSNYYKATLYTGALFEMDSGRVFDSASKSVHAVLADHVSALNAETSRAESAEQANLDALSVHKANKTNPHNVTKAQVGLGNVDNTSDANKPISNAQATVNSSVSESMSNMNSVLTNHLADKTNPHNVTKAQVGLGNVDNTSDADKPISNPTKEALLTKQGTLSVSNGTTVQLALSNDVLSASYVMPTAGESTLGGVKIVDTLTTDGENAYKAVYSKTVSKALTSVVAGYTEAIATEDKKIQEQLGTQVTYTYSNGTLYIVDK